MIFSRVYTVRPVSNSVGAHPASSSFLEERAALESGGSRDASPTRLVLGHALPDHAPRRSFGTEKVVLRIGNHERCVLSVDSTLNRLCEEVQPMIDRRANAQAEPRRREGEQRETRLDSEWPLSLSCPCGGYRVRRRASARTPASDPRSRRRLPRAQSDRCRASGTRES